MANVKTHRSLPGKPVRFPSRDQGNPFSPLPPDYEKLSHEGQRLARVNACCMQDTADDLVTAWDFFRRTYLMTSPPGFFYGDDLVESPPMHYEMVHSLGEYQFNLSACPRGYAKSTVADEVILLMVLSHPGFPAGLCLSIDGLVGERFDIYQRQFTDNEMILQDFGNLKPAKGQGKFNEHLISLTNGSRVKGFAVEGKKRGTKPRPRLLVLDDPEHDPKGVSTDLERLRQDFEWLLFRVLMPMGEKGMSMWWVGTMITKKAAIYHALHSEDSRFEKWNRRLWKDRMQVEDADGTGGVLVPTWNAMWGEQELLEKENEIGPAAYAAEYRNEPGESLESTFKVHPQLCTYEVDGGVFPYPLKSDRTLVYHVKEKGTGDIKVMREPYGEKVGKMTRMMMVDYASTTSRLSDFSAVVVVGFERPQDVLWVLDCFVDRVKEGVLIRKVYEMGKTWRPSVVGIEAVSVQQRVYESAAEFIEARAGDDAWTPRVFPIRYQRAVAKESRIAGMEWRFNTYRIKLPAHLRQARYWNMLWQQILDFQAEVRDGNLQHDDAVDALCMYQEMHRAKVHPDAQPDERILSPISRMLAGEYIDRRTGIPVMTGLNMSELPPEVIGRMLSDAGRLLMGEDDRDLSMSGASREMKR